MICNQKNAVAVHPLFVLLQGALLSCALLLSGSGFVAAAGLPTPEASDSQDEKLPIEDLQRFTKVVEYIKEYYVKPVKDDVLFDNAMHGMAAGLDPHSYYLDKEEYAELKTKTTGKFGGLGVEIIPEDGFIRVISPIDDSPAQRAGIQAGDLIIKLNDTPVKGLTVEKALATMRGEKGTKITLTIIRQGETKPLQISVVRDIINSPSVRGKILEDAFAYIRVATFQDNSGDDLVRTLQTLKKNSGGTLKGLILDLRNNTGGIVNSAVQIADAFLDRDKLKQYDGVIVYTKGRLPGSQIKEKAHASDLLNGAPLVVLINGGSASASEIVAGALQDYHRAVLVGTQTFGKGSVQTVLPLKGDRGLALTTALYYTPAGRSIQAMGIKPDIVVQHLKIPAPTDKADKDAWNALVIREEDLPGRLANGNAASDSAIGDKDKENKDKAEEKSVGAGAHARPASGGAAVSAAASSTELLYTDYQLHEALNVLKGLTLNR